MIPIHRQPLPTAAADRMATLTNQIRAASIGKRTIEARALWRKTSTRTHVVEPVKAVLQEMSPGIKRCMYCGDSYGTDVDHHEPIAHDPLRTFDRLNHLLACSFCNSHQKRNAFPTDARGRALLIGAAAVFADDVVELLRDPAVRSALGA